MGEQMQIFEPEHHPEVEQAIYLAVADEHFENLLFRERMHNIFRTIQSHASLALWNSTRDLENFEAARRR